MTSVTFSRVVQRTSELSHGGTSVSYSQNVKLITRMDSKSARKQNHSFAKQNRSLQSSSPHVGTKAATTIFITCKCTYVQTMHAYSAHMRTGTKAATAISTTGR